MKDLIRNIFAAFQRERPTLRPVAADSASLAPGRFCEFASVSNGAEVSSGIAGLSEALRPHPL